ncbi:MAG: hypothetical protein HYV03_02770 [Deltaproteobacteria bacterium]|nr:hypothetical protein [Deltaproteobacteria bacterium]
MKHRTQVLLDHPQYDFLKALARKEGVGLGELVRRFVEEKRQAFFRHFRKDPIEKRIGIFRDPECTSENYEDFLYGKPGE